jgi:hypothetical protein
LVSGTVEAATMVAKGEIKPATNRIEIAGGCTPVRITECVSENQRYSSGGAPISTVPELGARRK